MFHECFAGGEVDEPWVDAPWDDDPDWVFTVAATLDPETILGRYRQQCAPSREVP